MSQTRARKIGMVLDHPFPPDPRVENEARYMAENGYEVNLFYPVYDTKSLQLTDGAYPYLKLYPYKFGQLTYKLSALAYTLPLFKWIMKSKIKDYLRKCAPDILHIHDMVIAEAAVEAGKEMDIPQILDLHENRPAIMRLYNHVVTFPGNILINLEKWETKQKELIKKADKVIVVTDKAKEAFTEQGAQKDKIHIVPNYIDNNDFTQFNVYENITERLQSTFNLLYIGDTSLRRGIDTVIQALPKIREQISQVRLVIVGKSSEDDKLKKLAEDLGMKDKILFEGWQDPSTFPSYILGSQIGLCPFKRNLHHDTTYANKLFQYLSLGCPVVVSDCPAQAEIVKKEKVGKIFQADNEVDFAYKIVELYQANELREEMGTRAKKVVAEKYNWQRAGRELKNIYKQLNHS